MQGATTCQFLYNAYGLNLLNAVTQVITSVLATVNLSMNAVITLAIFIFGKRMSTGALSWDEGVTRIIRVVVVVALMGAGNYTQFVVTPVGTTIPSMIVQAVTGQSGLTIAQGYDALINEVNKYVVSAESQLNHWYYMMQWAAMWIMGWLCGIVIIGCYVISVLADATAKYLLPLGIFLIPGYLFDSLRDFVMRWVGKLVSLFLVMAVTLMLGQTVVYQDKQYIQDYAKDILSPPPEDAFNMVPDLSPSDLQFGPTTPGAQSGQTMNTPAALVNLAQVSLVLLFGLALMIFSTMIALHIGGSSGFSASPIFNAASAGLEKIAPRKH